MYFLGGKINSGVEDIIFLKEFYDGWKLIYWIYLELLLF